MLLKRRLLVKHLSCRSGLAGASEPVLFYIEKHHGIRDNGGGILLVTEIDLALDALLGGNIKIQIACKGIVSQWGPSFKVLV